MHLAWADACEAGSLACDRERLDAVLAEAYAANT